MEPGWIHELAAAVVLRSLQDRKINVGMIDDFAQNVPGAEDETEPAVLLARVFAHLGHRLPLLKKIEKRLEGREARSGFGADMAALLLQLYLRNRDIIATALMTYRQSKAESGVGADRRTEGA